jgi:putative toxin-antitoxin system antitoxin component (TIGR02293 family)
VTNVSNMKKITQNKNASIKSNPQKLEEPTEFYKTLKVLPSLKDFTYNDFKKISDKTPFTQAEWAAMLHVSERTLQRYAKSNNSFASINAERALQIAKLMEEGKKAFGKVENFYNWLKREPYMLEGNLSLNSLTSYDGIEKVLTQLRRIQHGLFA